METAGQTHVRTLKRRDARARRSAWLGRVLFSLTGMGLLLILRQSPGTVEDVVLWFHDVPVRDTAQHLNAPTDINVRRMPADVVPVRRGGALTANAGHSAQNADLQDQAQAVQSRLNQLDPSR